MRVFAAVALFVALFVGPLGVWLGHRCAERATEGAVPEPVPGQVLFFQLAPSVPLPKCAPGTLQYHTSFLYVCGDDHRWRVIVAKEVQ